MLARSPFTGRRFATADGYTFYEKRDGSWVDNLDPERVDMSFGSEEEAISGLVDAGYTPEEAKQLIAGTWEPSPEEEEILRQWFQGESMGRARAIVEEESPRSFLKKIGADPFGRVAIRVGAPLNPQTVVVPVHWVYDMVSTGGDSLPGVVLHTGDAPPAPQGMTKPQYSWMLAVIAYALNEGPVFQEDRPRDDADREMDPEDDMWLPDFSWEFLGGEKVFDRAMEWAIEHPGERAGYEFPKGFDGPVVG